MTPASSNLQERVLLTNREAITSRNYWLERLRPLSVRARAAPASAPAQPAPATYRQALPVEMASRLNQVAKGQAVALNIYLLAAYRYCWHTYARVANASIGVPATQAPADASAAGSQPGWLPVTGLLAESATFKDLVKQTQRDLHAAYQHQRYAPALLATESGLPGPEALFDLLFVPSFTDRLPELPFPACALVLTVQQAVGQLVMQADYQDPLPFDIASFMGYYQTVLEASLRDANTPLSVLARAAYLPPLGDGRGLSAPLTTVLSLWEAQVAHRPTEPAIVFGAIVVSYQQADAWASRVAARLRGTYHLHSGEHVALLVERSNKLPLLVLALLKAKLVGVLLDPAHPTARNAHILRDSAARLLVTQEPVVPAELVPTGLQVVGLAELETAALGSSPGLVVSGEEATPPLAFLVYVAGASGQPQGVKIGQASLAQRLLGLRVWLGEDASLRLPLVASPATDSALAQLLLPLLVGGQLQVLSEAVVSSPAALLEALAYATAFYATPALLQQLLLEATAREGNRLEHLRQVWIGEGACPPALQPQVRQLFPQASLTWLYGPAESTLCCAALVYPTATAPGSAPAGAIGQPLPGTSLYVLAADAQPLPVGALGEIFIGGEALADGYWHNEPLTSQKFMHPAGLQARRLFNTGDLGRVQPDGTIALADRDDDQPLFYRQRLELAEIEQVLRQHPAVDNCTVQARKHPQSLPYLAAFYHLRAPLASAELRAYAQENLPAALVPATWTPLAEWPLLVSGGSLPDPPSPLEAGAVSYTAPVSTLEKQLVPLWEKVLGQAKVSVSDNFFELGGHSLKAVQLASLIYKELQLKASVKLIFTHPTVEKLAQALATGASQAVYEEVTLATQRLYYDLSDAQRRLWTLSQLEEQSVAYNTPGAFFLEGPLDVEAYRQALEALVERHESLRTVFIVLDEQPKQKILAPELAQFELRREDLRPYGDEAVTMARARVMAEAKTAFDLARGPLLRAQLLQLEDERYVFLFNMHHIINDGWSTEVLVKELLMLYNAFVHKLRSPLVPLRIQYKDFALWQQARFGSQELEKARAYWLAQLGGELPALELPTDFPRPPIQTFNGAMLRFELPAGITRQLTHLGKEHDASLFTLLLAAVNVLLYKYTGQQDLIVGTPLAGREHADLENQIGFYVHTLALRTQLEPAAPFTALLAQVKATTLEAHENQLYPFDRLVEELRPRRDMSRSPVFDVLMTLDHPTVTEQQWVQQSGLKLTPFLTDFATSKFDLTVRFTEKDGVLHGSLEYNTDLFAPARIQRMAGHLRQLLGSIVAQPAQPVSQISYLPAAERRQLLEEFNATDLPLAPGRTLLELLREQTRLSPQVPAVYVGAKSLTYQELDEQSSRLASYLRAEYGVRAEDIVGVLVERSEMLLIGLLGILKSGAAYVPLDPAYPEQRLRYLLADSQPKLVLTQQALLSGRHWLWEAGPRVELLDELLLAAPPCESGTAPVVEPTDLAYVIYTSGSTGQPKGVSIEHGSVYAFLEWARREFDATPFQILYAATSYCFDLSVFELFYPLTVGKAVRILASGGDIEAALAQEEQQVLLNTVPSVVAVLLQESVALTGKVAALNMAGEPVPVHFRQQLPYRQLEVRNLYGPSEDTTYSTCYRFSDDYQLIPVGKPIANTRVYLLDADQQLVPVGARGEIYLSGAGVARGYLRRSELSHQKFLPDPYWPGQRMYRTGDLGQWLPDGAIEFLGRVDNQVKLNGYRIELGEIEAALLQHPTVTQAVVVVKTTERGQRDLVAYLVSPVGPSPDALKAYLGARLPAYMLPRHYVYLPALPLTPNGKLDRSRLPDPQGTSAAPTGPLRPGLEQELATGWAEVLGCLAVGPHDNFFDLGGNSLKAIQLLARIRKSMGLAIEFRDFFQHPTIAEMARAIEQRTEVVHKPILPLPAQEAYALSSAQQRMWLTSQLGAEANRAYNMAFAYRVEGRLEIELLTSCLRTVVQRHESLRTVFRAVHGGAQQVIRPDMPLVMRIEQLPEEGLSARTVALRRLRADIYDCFDLEQGPLFRSLLLLAGPGQAFFLFTIHHLICDGWSLKVLMEEVFALYRAACTGQAAELAHLPIQYKDYAHWQNDALATGQLSGSQEFWRQQLSPAWPALSLAGPATTSALHEQAGLEHLRVPTDSLRRLEVLAHEAGATLFMLLSAAVNLLLYNYSGNTDFVVGTPVASREHPDLQHQVGFYLNLLPLRTRFAAHATLGALLEQAKTTVLDAYKHQDYPYDRIVDDLRSSGHLLPNGLFDVVIDMVDFYAADHDQYQVTDELRISLEPLNTQFSRFDLTIYFNLKETYLAVDFEYNTGRYGKEKMQKMVQRFGNLLTALTESSLATPLADISIDGPVVLPAITPVKFSKRATL